MAWTALTALLAAGCATMPDSGAPERVDPPQGAGADKGVQVRVIPVPPQEGQSAREVLQNFLDAAIADDPTYRTAKQYLTSDAASKWSPDNRVVVLDNTTGLVVPSSDPEHPVVSINATEVGSLDSRHTYTAVQRAGYEADFTLVNVAKDAKDGKDGKDAAAKAQWRIADLPAALIINQTNFRNTFQQADRYFLTKADPASSNTDQPVLVPDPVYLRRRIDPASAAATALAEGPSSWLEPAVRSAFEPSRTALTVNTDDPRNPRLQLDGMDFHKSAQQCREMAAQLYFTLVSQSGIGSIDRVTLTSNHSGCDMNGPLAKSLFIAPGSLAGDPIGPGGISQSYARRADTGQLVRLLGPDTLTPTPVAGALGANPLPPALAPVGTAGVSGAFAVRRDGATAAVVSEDGRALYLAGLRDGDKINTPVATSGATKPGQGFASPSWDGFGGLWVVDRDPAAPKVLLLVKGPAGSAGSTGPAPMIGVTVAVDPQVGRTVDGIRLSSDGTRAALLLRDNATGSHSLAVGLVTRGGSPGHPSASISGLRTLAGQLSDVSSVSWADPDLLLVLGKERDSLQQLHYLRTDGTDGADSALQGVDGMTVVAASENRGDPVLADSKDSQNTIYGLSGTVQPQWRAFGKPGLMPAYPS
ncbi:LpqB family beta-propeller domain-containing protein [Kitasatospora nipponensis]|uniref:LpqB family beta-propeller domain-containing protein n=1 Tax=Kitasatospora nipponensis TaxID=258049 RepID=A0ABP4GQS9_9ACTN